EVANGLGAVVVGINFFGNFAHLSGSQTFTIQPKAKLAHLLLLVAEHGPQHRLEVPKSVAGNPQAQLFSVATPWPGRCALPLLSGLACSLRKVSRSSFMSPLRIISSNSLSPSSLFNIE